jgi:hypothetical protein
LYKYPMEHLIRHIAQRADRGGGTWSVGREQVLELLATDITDAYPRIARAGTLAEFSRFTSLNPGNLVSFLELLGHKDAGERMMRAGLWLPDDLQIELQRVLVERAGDLRLLHNVDYPGFLGIFDDSRSLGEAIARYLEMHFPVPELIAWSAERILENRGDIHPRSRRLVEELAGELIRRGIVPYLDLFSELLSDLAGFLVTLGKIPDPEAERNQSDGRSRRNDGDPASLDRKDRSWALKIFSFSPGIDPEPHEIRRRYKQLMKTWHPDINPQGLETAKNINRAYAFLIGGAD